MTISITGLEPEPVPVPIGSPTPFVIVGTGLKTKGLSVGAAKDKDGAPVDKLSVDTDSSRVATDNRLPVVAYADFGVVPGSYFVALKENDKLKATHSGIKVI